MSCPFKTLETVYRFSESNGRWRPNTIKSTEMFGKNGKVLLMSKSSPEGVLWDVSDLKNQKEYEKIVVSNAKCNIDSSPDSTKFTSSFNNPPPVLTIAQAAVSQPSSLAGLTFNPFVYMAFNSDPRTWSLNSPCPYKHELYPQYTMWAAEQFRKNFSSGKPPYHQNQEQPLFQNQQMLSGNRPISNPMIQKPNIFGAPGVPNLQMEAPQRRHGPSHANPQSMFREAPAQDMNRMQQFQYCSQDARFQSNAHPGGNPFRMQDFGARGNGVGVGGGGYGDRKCYTCNKLGHISSTCPERREKFNNYGMGRGRRGRGVFQDRGGSRRGRGFGDRSDARARDYYQNENDHVYNGHNNTGRRGGAVAGFQNRDMGRGRGRGRGGAVGSENNRGRARGRGRGRGAPGGSVNRNAVGLDFYDLEHSCSPVKEKEEEKKVDQEVVGAKRRQEEKKVEGSKKVIQWTNEESGSDPSVMDAKDTNCDGAGMGNAVEEQNEGDGFQEKKKEDEEEEEEEEVPKKESAEKENVVVAKQKKQNTPKNEVVAGAYEIPPPDESESDEDVE